LVRYLYFFLAFIAIRHSPSNNALQYSIFIISQEQGAFKELFYFLTPIKRSLT